MDHHVISGDEAVLRYAGFIFKPTTAADFCAIAHDNVVSQAGIWSNDRVVPNVTVVPDGHPVGNASVFLNGNAVAQDTTVPQEEKAVFIGTRPKFHWSIFAVGVKGTVVGELATDVWFDFRHLFCSS